MKVQHEKRPLHDPDPTDPENFNVKRYAIRLREMKPDVDYSLVLRFRKKNAVADMDGAIRLILDRESPTIKLDGFGRSPDNK